MEVWLRILFVVSRRREVCLPPVSHVSVLITLHVSVYLHYYNSFKEGTENFTCFLYEEVLYTGLFIDDYYIIVANFSLFFKR